MNLNEKASAKAEISPCLRRKNPSRAFPESQPFTSEQELVAAFKAAFADVGSGFWAWFNEFESPCGIADLVAVRLATTPVVSSVGRVPARWTYALKRLPLRAPFTLAWFSEANATSEGHCRGILQLYLQAGFCSYDASAKTWMKVEEPEPIAEKIVAVEAKLRDWRKALYQASRYLDYASQSWVVLDHCALPAAHAHVDEFSHRGIGLMGLGSHGEIEVISRPVERVPRMIARYWQANAEIAKRLTPSGL